MVIRLEIVADRPITRCGLSRVVEARKDFRVVAEHGAWDDALTDAQHVADVVLLDVDVPGPRCVEFVAAMRARWPEVKILVLGEQLADRRAVGVLRAGAAGYFSKLRTPDELAEAIRKVHATGRYVSERLGEQLADELLAGCQNNPREALSNRELLFLTLLTGGLSAKQIAAAMKVSPKTVSTYRARVLEKLGLTNNSELIRCGLEYELDAREHRPTGNGAGGGAVPRASPGVDPPARGRSRA